MYYTFNIQTESVEFASDGSSGMIIVEELVVTAGLVPGNHLSPCVSVTTLNVQGKAVHSAHYHVVLLHSTATYNTEQSAWFCTVLTKAARTCEIRLK